MEIHAYPEPYVANAMMTMGTMLDYAVNYRHENIDFFFRFFINLGFARQFEIGNPDVITGKSGVELYRMVKCDYISQMPEYIAFNRSPQFWLGWALAYYQWYSGRSYREITEKISLSEMLRWYPTLHEADLMRFVDEVEERFRSKKSKLQIRREIAGLSQAQLANLSGVNVRSIQMYEQRQNDIAKAQFNILSALARVLGCMPSELIDKDMLPYPVLAKMEPFQMDLLRGLEKRNRKFETEQNVQYYDYLSQFPYQNMYGSNGNYQMQTQPFLDHWNQYWRPMAQTQKQRKLIEEIAKELISKGLHDSGEPNTSIAFDSYCLLTADHLFDAVSSALNIIETVFEEEK